MLVSCFHVAAKPSIVWLRPLEIGVERDRTTIIGGSQYDTMRFLARQISAFEHRFESYPVKRNWFLIKTATTEQQVYCFYGAGYQAQREEWGIYSSPTAIGLPYLIAAKKGTLDLFNNNGVVSLEHLLRNGYKTVLYDQVSNPWTEQVKSYDYPHSIVHINGIDIDLNKHTLQLIEVGRIDFGYVAHKELSHFTAQESEALSLFQIREFSQQVRQTKRVLCSRSAIGQAAVGSIDYAVTHIWANASLNAEFMRLNFKADGYSMPTQSVYEALWAEEFGPVAQ